MKESLKKILEPSKRVILFFIFWISFHSFALVTSYSQIGIFNNLGVPKTSKLWPFVSFTYEGIEVNPAKQKAYFEYQRASDTIQYKDSLTGLNAYVDVKKVNSEAKKVPYQSSNYYDNVTHFSGLFNNYDWSEFVIYVGGALMFYLVIKLSDNSK